MHFLISSQFHLNRAEKENENDLSEMEIHSAFPSYHSIWLTIDLMLQIRNGNACLCEWENWGWDWKDWGEVMLITCRTTSQYISLHYTSPLPRPSLTQSYTQKPFHSDKSKMGKYGYRHLLLYRSSLHDSAPQRNGGSCGGVSEGWQWVEDRKIWKLRKAYLDKFSSFLNIFFSSI